MNEHLKQDKVVTLGNESHGATSMAEQETDGEEEAPNRIDRNAEDAARSCFNPITTLYEWSEATPERMVEALYLIAPSNAPNATSNTATTTSNADHVSI